MKWSDRAIILSSRRLGENSAIITLISPEHGMYAGVDRGAFSKSKRGIYQVGNVVTAHWQARLPEQIGMVYCELQQSVASLLIDEPLKLAVINSASAMVEKVLLERERQPIIFTALEFLIHSLCHDGDYLADYVRLELDLLACSGFGIDLERCAATGQIDDLIYVSPKSGRAVSRKAGEVYKDRLLPLPAFLDKKHNAPHGVSIEDISAGIKLCGYFFAERIFIQRNIPVPSARARLITMIGKRSALLMQNFERNHVSHY